MADKNDGTIEDASAPAQVNPVVSKKVSSSEITDLLRKIGKGEIIPKLMNEGHTWEATYAGNVSYVVDGWEIVIFNDCDSWDYIDSVLSPDGRKGDYSDWFGEDGQSETDEVLYREDNKIYEQMIDAFIAAC